MVPDKDMKQFNKVILIELNNIMTICIALGCAV